MSPHQVRWIVGESGPLFGVPRLRAFLPSVHQGHYVIDLYLTAASGEIDHCAAEWVDQRAREGHATVRPCLHDEVSQITAQDVVPCVATVAIDVLPRLPEQGAVVARLGSATLDLERQRRSSRLGLS